MIPSLTPSQIQANTERKLRLARINAQSVEPKPVLKVLPRLEEMPQAAPEPISFEVACEALDAYQTEHQHRTGIDEAPKVFAVQRHVARHFGLTAEDLISHTRTNKVVIPRHIAMFLCREIMYRPHTEIGRRFKRDHSVSIFAHRKIANKIRRDEGFAIEVQAIASKFGGLRA